MIDRDFMNAPWRYVPSAMSLFDPFDPKARTGIVIAETSRGDLVCVIPAVDESVGKRVANEHNIACAANGTVSA